MNAKFYFTWNNEEEKINHIDWLHRMFRERNLIYTLNIDDSEKIGDIEIPSLDKEVIESFLCWYSDDEMRIVMIADQLIMSTDKMLKEVGL